MITTKQMENLKKKSVSIDTEKVKARVPEIYKSSTKEQKDALKKLTGGMSHNVYYNVAKSGSATAKVVLSLAQVLGVSPYYLTGEIDDKEISGEDVLKEFYQKCTAGKAKVSKTKTPKAEKAKPTPKAKTATKKASPAKAKAEKIAKAAKPARAVKAAPAPAKQKPVRTDEDYDIVINNTPQFDKLVKNLKEDEAIILLKALVLKAKAGGEAEILWDTVKRCLVKS